MRLPLPRSVDVGLWFGVELPFFFKLREDAGEFSAIVRANPYRVGNHAVTHEGAMRWGCLFMAKGLLAPQPPQPEIPAHLPNAGR